MLQFLVCFEWWLNRYQTLIVGILAVVIAYRQTTIMRKQAEITVTQIEQAKAIAKLKIVSFMRSIEPFRDLTSRVIHEQWLTDDDHRYLWNFDEQGFPWLEKNWDSADLKAAATEAYPQEADAIARLVDAADETAHVLADFKGYDVLTGWGNASPESMSPQERQANIATNRLFHKMLSTGTSLAA